MFMVSSAEILRQRLPTQDLSRLSLVSHQPKKLQEWIAALPMMNVGETSRQVFQTLQEICRLNNIDVAARFELLEILRPTVHTLGAALAKHYLNQSVMLPDRATKVATLAQAMQSHLANGYKLVALAALEKLTPHKHDVEIMKLAAQGIHRAISELTGNLLRSTQLYLNTPPRLWLELHTLYLTAAEHQMATALRVNDSSHRHTDKSTIEDVYKRALLLATCKPNKLRQSEIAQVHELGEMWAPLVSLKEFSRTSELFVFDLSKDAPPTYRSPAQASDAAHVRAIDPATLVKRLNELKQIAQSGSPKAHGEAALSLSLLEHLILAWSELSERSFSRVTHDGTLQASIGLTATHYFMSGNQSFDIMMKGEQGLFQMVADTDNPFLKAKPITLYRPDEVSGKDVWSLAFGNVDTESREQPLAHKQQGKQPDPGARYDTHTCQIVNISPGGYCIEWAGEVPASVRAGEILGLHEESQPGWSIGVIRWVKQLPGHGAQLGIEVLAPKAKPCGARVIKKTGDATEYMRTLLLPELKAINRPATLITPALTFRSGYKLLLNLDGEEIKAHLTRQVSATPSFCQFEFQLTRRTQDTGEEPAQSSNTSSDDDFDSIWASL